jgi:hypothetical protein
MALKMDRDSLSEKTVAELREICRKKKIPGMSKARKDDIIDSLLKSSDTKVEKMYTELYTTITKVGGEIKDVETMVHISAGAASLNQPLVGETVGSVAEKFKHILNINARDINPLINGKSVNESYVLKARDNLEFLKPASVKGGEGGTVEPKVKVSPLKGKKLSDEAKKKMSEAQKLAQNRPEVKAKKSASLKIAMSKPEVKAKISATRKSKKAAPAA